MPFSGVIWQLINSEILIVIKQANVPSALERIVLYFWYPIGNF